MGTLTDAGAPGYRLVHPVSWKLRLGVALMAAAVLAGAVAVARFHMWVTSRTAPTVAAPDILESLTDRRLVRITITTSSWKTVPMVVPLNQLGWDRAVWRQMHFGDWDRLPSDVRERPLRRMAHVYDPLLRQPAAWRRMTAADWDQVPQPIRAIAFLRMTHHWAVSRQVGAEFGLDPVRMGRTVGGIIMAESWFDHRAEHVNPYGNRDVGLAQCSNHCRRTLAEMAKSGAISFAPDDEDYFNPWIATWVATVWFERELGRAEGDVELAIRAYHRGLDAAMDERGTAYLANVLRLRERYVRTQRTSASWRFLVDLISSKAPRARSGTNRTPGEISHAPSRLSIREFPLRRIRTATSFTGLPPFFTLRTRGSQVRVQGAPSAYADRVLQGRHFTVPRELPKTHDQLAVSRDGTWETKQSHHRIVGTRDFS